MSIIDTIKGWMSGCCKGGCSCKAECDKCGTECKDGVCSGHEMKCEKCGAECKDGVCGGHEMKCDGCEAMCKDGKCSGHEMK